MDWRKGASKGSPRGRFAKKLFFRHLSVCLPKGVLQGEGTDSVGPPPPGARGRRMKEEEEAHS